MHGLKQSPTRASCGVRTTHSERPSTKTPRLRSSRMTRFVRSGFSRSEMTCRGAGSFRAAQDACERQSRHPPRTRPLHTHTDPQCLIMQGLGAVGFPVRNDDVPPTPRRQDTSHQGVRAAHLVVDLQVRRADKELGVGHRVAADGGEHVLDGARDDAAGRAGRAALHREGLAGSRLPVRYDGRVVALRMKWPRIEQ